MIRLENIAKRYASDWLFRDINYEFKKNNSYAIIGHNGSGKSTLLQIILGTVIPTKGKVHYSFDKSNIQSHLSFVAPYQNLPLDLTLAELYQLHLKCKGFEKEIDREAFLEKTKLKDKQHTLLQSFSSGMAQRVKLALAFYSKSSVILLDEPIISLDNQNIEWYQEEIQKIQNKKLILISSNDEKEYFFCDKKINVLDYKRV